MKAALRVRPGFPWTQGATPAGIEPPPAEKHTGGDYDTAWARRYPARIARVLVVEGLMRPTVAVLAEPERTGFDRLAGLEGPAVFAANHHSHIDTPLMLTSIPEPWRHHLVVAAAADYFFATRAGGTLSSFAFNAIPIERTKVGRRSADLAVELISEGWSMLIFPEGGRSPDGWGQPFRGGAAYVSMKCSVPVVPVYLDGTGRILRKGKRLPTPSSTRVTFGAPVRADDGEDSRRFGARIERAVAALADETATDWYRARLRAHADGSPSLSGPQSGSWRRAWALPERRRQRSRRRRWPDV
jgi:1-acyl-sn-glycerol-3-phosphate acyltransferase